jgi:L-glyceraldehyde 3-phosphate reductase
MSYIADEKRYERMRYRRCGESGLKLSAISLGLWHNFGKEADFEACRDILKAAFDNGVTHFDLANNYGPGPGAAEENFGRVLAADFKAYRDEMIISTKAGYYMWPGPYGNGGSKKYLIASLDQSLKRMGLEYVDIFYHHRPDPETAVEETAGALDRVVRQGKALYIGISNYSPGQTEAIVKAFEELKTPFVIHQAVYNMLNRGAEKGLIDVLTKERKGLIAYSPLAQGLLTDRYFNGIPSGSRASKSAFLKPETVEKNMEKIMVLNAIARRRGQSLAQMALAWLLNNPAVTSVLIGVSTRQQLLQNLKAIENTSFSEEDLKQIDEITM